VTGVQTCALPILQMPRRDGFGLAEDVQGDPALRDSRVMLLTSAGQRGDAERCRVLGVRAYLQKPVSRVELIDAALAAVGESADSGGVLVTRSTMDETRRRLRVLLAEDNPVNQEVAVAMLRKRGHEVVVANNGREAIAEVGRRTFDVVLMDLQMPEVDGFEATHAIQAGHPQLPIIALTANTTPGERDRCLAAGMSGYLAKPFKSHELFSVIEGWAPRDAAPAEADGRAPVDLDRFHKMMEDAGIPETAPRMLEVFQSDSATRIAELADAAQRGDVDVVGRVAHRLKSGAASICATDLADLLGRAEEAATGGDVGEAQAAVRSVENEYARVAEQLRSHLRATLGATSPK